MGLFRQFVSKYLAGRRKDGVSSIRPLASVRHVVVYLDARLDDAGECETGVNDFFSSRSIRCDVVKVASSARLPRLSGDEDMVISLLPEPSFRQECSLIRMNVPFKVGREQIAGNVFSLVVSDPEGQAFSQSEVFREMSGILLKIA